MTLDEAIEAQTRNAEDIVRLEQALAGAMRLLTHWIEAADIAKDMAFVPVAFATRAFLAEQQK